MNTTTVHTEFTLYRHHLSHAVCAYPKIKFLNHTLFTSNNLLISEIQQYAITDIF